MKALPHCFGNGEQRGLKLRRNHPPINPIEAPGLGCFVSEERSKAQPDQQLRQPLFTVCVKGLQSDGAEHLFSGG